jgi:hypothetical protein
MSIEDLFDMIVGYSCGLCCSKDYQCEKCIINCLKANGLKLELANQIRGLKQVSRNHSTDPFGFSELCYKLKELRKDENNFQRESYPH